MHIVLSDSNLNLMHENDKYLCKFQRNVENMF